MADRVLLLVDLNNQLRRAMHSHMGLTSGSTFTGGVYGFLQGFAKVIQVYQVTTAVLCMDKRPYRRAQEYPEYKAKRPVEDEAKLRAIAQSRRLASEAALAIGVPMWEVEGFEADDLIAYAVHRERRRYERVIVWSNDTDLFQLLVSANILIDRKDEVMTRAKLLTQHGLTPEQHLALSVLQGSHNDITGIARVGRITAKKAVFDPALWRQFMANHGDIIRRNQYLMTLPHPLLPANLGLPRPTSEFDHRTFSRWAGRYDIRATGQMLDSFEQLVYR